jgi:hypothetical protein
MAPFTLDEFLAAAAAAILAALLAAATVTLSTVLFAAATVALSTWSFERCARGRAPQTLSVAALRRLWSTMKKIEQCHRPMKVQQRDYHLVRENLMVAIKGARKELQSLEQSTQQAITDRHADSAKHWETIIKTLQCMSSTSEAQAAVLKAEEDQRILQRKALTQRITGMEYLLEVPIAVLLASHAANKGKMHLLVRCAYARTHTRERHVR